MFHVTVTLSNYRDMSFDSDLSEVELIKRLNKKWMRLEDDGKVFLVSSKDIFMVQLENIEKWERLSFKVKNLSVIKN